MGDIVALEERRHDQADADPEQEREHQAGNGQIHADRHARVGQSQDVGRRGEEQEGDGRPQAGPLPVDPRKQGHNRTGADREDRTSERCRRVRDALGCVAAQEPGDRFLGDQGRQRARDEESGHQAQQYVGSEVGRQVAGAALQQAQ